MGGEGSIYKRSKGNLRDNPKQQQKSEFLTRRRIFFVDKRKRVFIYDPDVVFEGELR